MPRVTFLHSDGRSGEVDANISLLEAAKEVGFRLNHDCGGNASPCVPGACIGGCRGTRAGRQVGQSKDSDDRSVGLIFEREVLD